MLSRLAVLRVRARAFQNYQFSLYSLTIDNINLRRGPLSRSLCLRSLSTQYGQQITTSLCLTFGMAPNANFFRFHNAKNNQQTLCTAWPPLMCL